MAQKTSWTGATLTESDINLYLMGEGGAWTTWSPAITQSGSVTATATHAVYGRWGRLIIASYRLSVTGSGTGSNAITVSLPVNAARSSGIIGTGVIFDNSAGLLYTGNAALLTVSTHGFEGQGGGVSPNTLGVAGSYFTAALASSDIIAASIMYEAAS